MRKIYEEKYKYLLIIPFALLILAIVQIGGQYAVKGDFINRGVTLKGGSTITVEGSNLNQASLEEYLNTNFNNAGVSVRTISSAGKIIGFTIESNLQDSTEIDKLVKSVEEQTKVSKNDMTVEVMGSALGKAFFKQTVFALLIAFLLMGSVVFVYFRSAVPSLAVILAAFSDIVVTLAIFNLTGIKLETAGIAAFLMLIGYSVDTDILLSTRVLKRKEGTVIYRIYNAMKTGFTMSATTLAVVTLTLIFVKSTIVKQIMIILFIGLLVDLVMTWIQNTGILRYYLERKKQWISKTFLKNGELFYC